MNPIQVEDLAVSYRTRSGVVEALRGVSFSVEEGGVVGFLGPNGAGKTTTLNVLLGFEEPTSGRARLYGCDSTSSIARRRVGFMCEHSRTHPFLTGRELLVMAGRLFGMRGSALRRAADSLLERVGLSGAADRRTGTYSRGMLQRMGLAQALINDPDLVILDEPTSGLDPVGRARVRELIAGLRSEGKTVFFSSHELSEVELVCDRVLMLVAGHIAASGSVDELVRDGESLERYFLKLAAERGGEGGVS
ncbi:MAG: ABC transporter ATP-binding protein [Lentisphaerae bacterium]|nr:ABC transporter ATP-binding protein [Lentisphaerota bacterium]